MNEELTKEILSCYSDEILNWLSNMSDDDKANFLYHLDQYGKDENEDKILFSKLENGKYMPHLISEKVKNLKKMKSHIIYDSIFSLLSGFTIANFKEYLEIISRYNLEPMKQLLLSTGYVLPPSIALSCTFMILYYWYHYSLCNYTIEDYQKLLNKPSVLELARTKKYKPTK